MLMPGGLPGLDLAQQLRNLKSNLKVVISSGYSTETIDEVKLASENITYLQKPFRIEVMVKTIRDSLGAR
jgi:DNA-binding NtrC family response regulator